MYGRDTPPEEWPIVVPIPCSGHRIAQISDRSVRTLTPNIVRTLTREMGLQPFTQSQSEVTSCLCSVTRNSLILCRPQTTGIMAACSPVCECLLLRYKGVGWIVYLRARSEMWFFGRNAASAISTFARDILNCTWSTRGLRHISQEGKLLKTLPPLPSVCDISSGCSRIPDTLVLHIIWSNCQWNMLVNAGTVVVRPSGQTQVLLHTRSVRNE